MPNVKIEYETAPQARARVAWEDVPEGSLVYDHDVDIVVLKLGGQWCVSGGGTTPASGLAMYTILPPNTPVLVSRRGYMSLVDPSILAPQEPLMSWEDVDVGQLVACIDGDGDQCVGWKDTNGDWSRIVLDTPSGTFGLNSHESTAEGLGEVFRPVKSITITRMQSK